MGKTVLKRYLIRIVLISSALLVLQSCGYGFLNIFTDTGSIELAFTITTDNPNDIDRIVYELTPPEGLPSRVEREYTGLETYIQLDNANTGSWGIVLYAYSGDVLQAEYTFEDIDGIEVNPEVRVTLKTECRWDGSGYIFYSSLWKNSDDGSANTDSTVPSQTVFTIAETRIMPAVYENYYTGDRKAWVNIRILGTNFYPDLESVELEYPDGSIYSFGYQDYYYNRTVQFYHNVDSDFGTMVEIQRNLGGDYEALSGSYFFHLEDVYSASVEYEESLSADPDTAVPKLLSCTDVSIPQTYTVIPHSLPAADEFDFEYSFDPGLGAGTHIVFILDRTAGTLFPVGDAIVVFSDTGFLNVPAATLSAGSSYELIAAAVEFPTTTPTTDASAVGISGSGLRSENLVSSLYQIYGADTGFIYYKSAPFSAY